MQAAPKDIRICFVGESFVNGTGDSEYLGWTGRVCQGLARRDLVVTHYNLGIRGETSAELLLRWQRECDRRLPANCDNRIVFSFGTNDTTIRDGKRRVEIPASLQHTRTILTTAKSNYSVMMISPGATLDPEQNARTQALSHQFAQLCAELDIPYLDVLSPLSQSPVWMAEVAAGDGAHPDSGGYAEYARLIETWDAWNTWFDS